MSAAAIVGMVLAILGGAILLLCAFALFAGFTTADTDPPRAEPAPEQSTPDLIDIRSFCQKWGD